MGFGAAFIGAWLLPAQLDMSIAVVQAADAPVRLDRAKILNTNDAPLVLLYAATNLTDDELDQFTVMVFVFDREGRLKARQVAPGRRTLAARSTNTTTFITVLTANIIALPTATTTACMP